jgi:hypothetical protein
MRGTTYLEGFMSQDESDSKSPTFDELIPADSLDWAQTHPVELALGLHPFSSHREAILTDLTTQEQIPPALDQSERKGMFVAHPWQRLYAHALLETDPVNLPLRIDLAESAILDRYLELINADTLTDEMIDLKNAETAVLDLREAIGVRPTAEKFLA